MAQHTADVPNAGNIESQLRFLAQNNLIADADLATSLATIESNITTKFNSAHQSLKGLLPEALKTVRAAYALLGSSTMTGGSLANVYAALDGTWNVGAR